MRSQRLGCPLEDRLQTQGFPAWGRSNSRGMKCLECASLPRNKAAVMSACGGTLGGESLETMVPKACGI